MPDDLTTPADRGDTTPDSAPLRTLPPHLDPRRGAPGAPDPTAQPAGTRTRRQRRKRILMWTAGGLAVLLLVVGIGGYAAVRHLLDNIHKINVFGSGQAADGASGDETILLVGSDSRAGLTRAQQDALHLGNDPGQRSDTMILLHIPKGSGKVELISLPRDSYVTIPAHTDSGGQLVPARKNKLNAAYSEGGARLTVSTIEAATHVHIDHYVEINFLGFVNMVDKLGGVTICLNSPINDPATGTGGSGLKLPAGNDHLGGADALKFVRAREFDPGEGDLGRIKRQQIFMSALVQRAESTGVLLDVPRLFGFLDAVSSSLTTDTGFGLSQMRTLASALHNLSPAHVEMTTVPLSNTSLSTPVGSAVLWDPVLSRQLFTDINDDRPITAADTGKAAAVTIPPSSIHVTVLNAAGTQGLAATAAAGLTEDGFGIARTGNAPAGSDPKAVVIRYGANRADSARTVAAAVPGSTVVADPTLPPAELDLLVGSSFHGTQRVTVTSATPSAAATIPVHTAAQAGCVG